MRKSFHRGRCPIEKMSNGHSDQRELDIPPLDEGEGRGSPASEMKIATRPGFFPSGRVKPKQNRPLMHFLNIATGIEGRSTSSSFVSLHWLDLLIGSPRDLQSKCECHRRAESLHQISAAKTNPGASR
jgi:hypothetical protein